MRCVICSGSYCCFYVDYKIYICRLMQFLLWRYIRIAIKRHDVIHLHVCLMHAPRYVCVLRVAENHIIYLCMCAQFEKKKVKLAVGRRAVCPK